jgi:hypothetical protein
MTRDKRLGAFLLISFIPAPDFPKLLFSCHVTDDKLRPVKESFKTG